MSSWGNLSCWTSGGLLHARVQITEADHAPAPPRATCVVAGHTLDVSLLPGGTLVSMHDPSVARIATGTTLKVVLEASATLMRMVPVQAELIAGLTSAPRRGLSCEAVRDDTGGSWVRLEVAPGARAGGRQAECSLEQVGAGAFVLGVSLDRP